MTEPDHRAQPAGAEAGYPGAEAGYPGAEAGYSGAEAGYPGAQAGYPGAQPPGAEAAYPGAPPSAPSFGEEIDEAVEYERGLAVKALLSLALVALVLVLRVSFFG